MQEIIARVGGQLRSRVLPDPDDFVIPGVRWGRYEHALTPAFWYATAWMQGQPPRTGYRLGADLREEVVACLLGGFGIPAEVGLAAFERVREAMSSADPRQPPSRETLEKLLSAPLYLKNGRTVRYRFARQRAGYVAAALAEVDSIDEDALNDVQLRDLLTKISGVGLKTASWVVRNRRASDHVAILDVHLVRACQAMAVFGKNDDPARHYLCMENRFLRFCDGLQVGAAIMDSVIWATMRSVAPPFMRTLLDTSRALVR